MAPASEEALRRLFQATPDDTLEILPREGIRLVAATPRRESIQRRIAPILQAPLGPTQVTREVRLRRGQEYFRQAVLNNAGGQCALTGLPLRELLVASHILPWSTHPTERHNVRNGLSLTRLHDAAFDQGLVAFDDNLQLQLSTRLKRALPHPAVEANFAAYELRPLTFPDDAHLPDPAFLAAHRKTIFLRD